MLYSWSTCLEVADSMRAFYQTLPLALCPCPVTSYPRGLRSAGRLGWLRLWSLGGPRGWKRRQIVVVLLPTAHDDFIHKP